MPAITPDLLERGRGCLLGAAVGDAFGMALEGAPARPSNNLMREMRPGRLESARFTAETEAILSLSGILLAGPPADAAELASRLAAGLTEKPVGVRTFLGRLTGREARTVAIAPPPEPSSQAVDARSLVYTLPMALANAGDRVGCLERVRSLLSVTYPHADCIAGGTFLAATFWHLLRGRPLCQAIQQSLRDCRDLPETLVEAIGLAAGSLRSQLKSDGQVRRTLDCVLWSLGTTATYAEAVTRAANLGGHASLTTALAGALAGIIYQQSGIPADWRMQVHGTWPPRGGRMWRERELVELADCLLQASIQ